MIKDPPVLRIRRGFSRPGADLVAAFAGAQTGNVVDAMGGRGALPARIKPLVESGTTVGVAVTSYSRPGDNLGLFASLDLVRGGDFLVAASDGFAETAIAGDLLAGMAKNLGAVGLVTDSAVRDKAGLLSVGLPVYSSGLTPNSPSRSGPGQAGLTVVIGGVAVRSGDIVVADADGVVIVPQDDAEAVLERLQAVRRAEAALEAEVRSGLGLPGFVQAIVKTDRTVEE